jgi:APA family basic amino acid/polyamine antiporter
VGARRHLSICGSLVLTELAVTHPKTGGLYVFIREAFGDAWAFVFGWANLWVIKPTVIASITSVFALYFCQALHLPKSAELGVGARRSCCSPSINVLGVKEGARTQSLFTTLKVIGILGVCAAAFLLPAHAGAPSTTAASALREAAVRRLCRRDDPVLFAYDGWTDATYVAGEVIEPKRTLPIAIVWGTWLVIAVYVLTNSRTSTCSGRRWRSTKRWAPRPCAACSAMGRHGARGAGRDLDVRHHERRDPDRPARDAGDGRGRLAVEAARRTRSEARDADAAPVDPGGAVVRVARWSRGFEDVSGWFVTTSWMFYGVTTAALFMYRRHEKEGASPRRLSHAAVPAPAMSSSSSRSSSSTATSRPARRSPSGLTGRSLRCSVSCRARVSACWSSARLPGVLALEGPAARTA